MTERNNDAPDFLIRLRKIDNAALKARDVIVLWAIGRHPGMMGRELAMKLGYKSRSNVQDCVTRLVLCKFVEDRRVVSDPKMFNRVPNDLWILPAGTQFLADVVPQ